jgi:hypothetical protein
MKPWIFTVQELTEVQEGPLLASACAAGSEIALEARCACCSRRPSEAFGHAPVFPWDSRGQESCLSRKRWLRGSDSKGCHCVSGEEEAYLIPIASGARA